MVATPLDLQKGKDFRKGFRGYNTGDVDSFVTRVLRDYEQIYRENIVLQEQLEELKEKLNQYEIIEDTLQKTLVVAQETAEEVKKNAEKEATLIVDKARLHGEEIVKAAERQVKEIQEEYQQLRQLETAYRAQLKAFVQAQMVLLEQKSVSTDAQPPQPIQSEKGVSEELNSVKESMAEVAVSVDEEERRSLGL